MPRTLLLLVLFAALALPASAAAKEAKQATVCGASDCTTVKGHDAIVFAEGGGPADPPAPGAFYTTRIIVQAGPGREATWRSEWVPASNVIGVRDDANGQWTWIAALPEQATALREATRGLEPFPASALRGARPAAPTHSPAPAADDGGLDWPVTVGIALAAMAAAAAGGLALRRHRRGPAAT